MKPWKIGISMCRLALCTKSVAWDNACLPSGVWDWVLDNLCVGRSNVLQHCCNASRIPCSSAMSAQNHTKKILTWEHYNFIIMITYLQFQACTEYQQVGQFGASKNTLWCYLRPEDYGWALASVSGPPHLFNVADPCRKPRVWSTPLNIPRSCWRNAISH